VCHRFSEDGGYLFFKCKAVKRIWTGLNLDDMRARLDTISSAKETVEIIPWARGTKEDEMYSASLDIVEGEK
jgi:hypothetical protein